MPITRDIRIAHKISRTMLVARLLQFMVVVFVLQKFISCPSHLPYSAPSAPLWAIRRTAFQAR